MSVVRQGLVRAGLVRQGLVRPVMGPWGNASFPLLAESVGYRTDLVPGIEDADLDAVNRFIGSLMGLKVPGLVQLSRNVYQFAKLIVFFGGRYQNMGGGLLSAISGSGAVKSFTGTNHLTPTSMSWSREGMRFVGAGRLSTSARVLQNNDRWTNIYIGNFLNYSGTQQSGVSQNANGSGSGRHSLLLIETTGGPRVFGHNGTGGGITNDPGAGTAFSVRMRAFMTQQNDTGKLIYVDGSATPLVPEATHAPGTIENTPFTIGALTDGQRPVNAGTVGFNLLLADATAANAVISGADFAAICENYHRCFPEQNLHGFADTARIVLPSRQTYEVVARVTQGASGGNRYFGSPDVIELEDGSLLASHDQWANAATWANASFYRQTTAGGAWTKTGSDLAAMMFGRLIRKGSDVYVLGVTADFNSNALRISKSTDNGATWSAPVTLDNNGNGIPDTGFMSAPNSVVEHNGRLYALIDTQQQTAGGPVGQWRPNGTMMISVAVEDDWLTAANWAGSNVILTDDDLRGDIQGTAPDTTTAKEVLEPEVMLVDGAILGLSRCLNMAGLACQWSFDPDTDAPNGVLSYVAGIPAGFGPWKFRHVKCPVTGWFLMFGNLRRAGLGATDDDRTRLCVYKSSDGVTWGDPVEVLEDLGDWDLSERGIQYPSAIVVGDDVVLGLRGAPAGSNSYHNSPEIWSRRITGYVQRWGLTSLI